jgi:hypothetical protein
MNRVFCAGFQGSNAMACCGIVVRNAFDLNRLKIMTGPAGHRYGVICEVLVQPKFQGRWECRVIFLM